MSKIDKIKRGGKILLKAPQHIHDLEKKNELLQKNIALLKEDLKGTKNHFQVLLDNADAKLSTADDRLSDVLHQLSSLSRQSSKTNSALSDTSELLADNHLLDHFYVQFEKNFRGNEAEIKDRQKVYLSYFEPIKNKTKTHPVLDIGCGRGEFVELLKEHDLRCIGLDLNETMVGLVKEKGLEAVEANAVTYLEKQKANSISAITGFHIVEHIPFDTLVEMFTECYRTLIPGGFVVFETPNPENVRVGSHSFYMDPSHLHPIPPALLEFTMKTRGFSKVEVLRLHPRKKPVEAAKNLPQEILEAFYGPQDYAIIAHK